MPKTETIKGKTLKRRPQIIKPENKANTTGGLTPNRKSRILWNWLYRKNCNYGKLVAIYKLLT